VNVKQQKFCAYMGLAFPLVFFVGWGLVAGYMLPLHGPHDTPAQVQSFYTHNTTWIRLGIIITIAAGAMQAPFSALIGVYMRRMEGGKYTPLAYAQMMLGSVGVLLVVIPMFVYAALAYRPETRDPKTMQFFSDFGWQMFIGAFSPAVLQSICLALAIFGDKRDKPVMPRWVGYFNVWVATLFLPGSIVIIAHGGPFAWNGLMAFWVPAVVFGSWFNVMFFVLRKCISDLAAEEAAAQSSATGLAPPATGFQPA
jgi:hypothetical protein